MQVFNPGDQSERKLNIRKLNIINYVILVAQWSNIFTQILFPKKCIEGHFNS